MHENTLSLNLGTLKIKQNSKIFREKENKKQHESDEHKTGY